MNWVWLSLTALVEIVRVIWDVSRFALVFAALHNLPEVAITSFLAFPVRPLLLPPRSPPVIRCKTCSFWHTHVYMLAPPHPTPVIFFPGWHAAPTYMLACFC